MWNFARTIQKKVILASYRYWEWKVDFFLKSQAQKIMGRPRRTIHIDRKTESLWQEDDALCLMGPESVIYYELLKLDWSETVNTKRYQQQLIDLNRSLLKKRPEYKVIFLHDNAPSRTAKPVWDTLEALSWEVLPHAAYSPDLAPSDYHLFASMGHALAQQRFGSYEDVKKWLDEWFTAKGEDFYWRDIHKIARKEKYVTSNGAYFEQISFYRSSEFNIFFFWEKNRHSYLYTWYIYI